MVLQLGSGDASVSEILGDCCTGKWRPGVGRRIWSNGGPADVVASRQGR